MNRVVYVSATDELGGSDASLFELVRCLDRTRFEPHVVLPHFGIYAARYRSLGVPVHVVPLKKLKNTLDPLWHARYLLRAPLRVLRVAALLRELAPSVVHLNTSVELLAGFAARRYCDRSGASLVWHVRELDLRPSWIEDLVFGAVARWADAVVAISTPLGERFAGRERVRVIPNGVDLARFVPRDALDAPAHDAAPVIGWLGRVVPIKGIDNVLEVFLRVRMSLPGARLLVVGSVVAGHEAYARELQHAASTSPAAHAIEWRGATARPESVYPEMDLFLHLPHFEEPLGRTLIEAQAAGVPVLTWPRGGLADTLDAGRTGRLVPAGDLDAAASAAVEMLSDRDALQRMSRAATAFARERFSADLCADRIEAVYEELVHA